MPASLSAEQVAQCWKEIGSGAYGGQLDQTNRSFKWLAEQLRFWTWRDAKAGRIQPSQNGSGRNGQGGSAPVRRLAGPEAFAGIDSG